MRWLLWVALFGLLTVSAKAQTPIGSVDTTQNLFGPNDKISADRYDDPLINGVSCYVSRAIKGGAMSMVGLSEDPSRFSVACRAVGHVVVPDNVPKQQAVFAAAASPLFKLITITRIVDAEKKVLIYLVTSTSLVSGSPFNSISAVVYGVKDQ